MKKRWSGGGFEVTVVVGVMIAYDDSSPEVEMRWWSWCGLAGGVGGDFRGG
nr:hypothetical protein [Tanacetum cinerariifolium]